MVVAVEIEGVKETLRKLQRIDPELRKQFTKNARMVAKPMVDAVKARYTTLPLSGFRRSWQPSRSKPITPTTIGRWRSGVSFKVDASKKAVTVFRIQQRNAAASVFDMAGRATPGNQLDRSLRAAGWGTPSRVMWPAVESKLPQVQDALAQLVAAASDTINNELR